MKINYPIPRFTHLFVGSDGFAGITYLLELESLNGMDFITDST